ncbi:MAG TPA: amino acid racemase, partial [Desulfopila sp.]|nr:amino acid racemase [Desulfopila sp.]
MPHDGNGQSNSSEKVVGILGGMGPEATIDLMQRILANTPALDDADHIRCIVDNNPKIPSRVQAILGERGENPGPCMAEMARGLQNCGADFIVIPCNTAHEYYSYVAEAVDVPVVHLVGLVVDQVISMSPEMTAVGILGSNTIIKTKIYTTTFQARGVEAIYPDPEVQEELFEIICRVKRGETGEDIRQEFREIANHLAGKGVDAAILG